jgi:putative intracellular protease/amidase
MSKNTGTRGNMLYNKPTQYTHPKLRRKLAILDRRVLALQHIFVVCQATAICTKMSTRKQFRACSFRHERKHKLPVTNNSIFRSTAYIQ